MPRRRATVDAAPALRAALEALRDPDDDSAIAAAITHALGVEAQVGGTPIEASADVERVYDLRDSVRDGRVVRLRFTNRYDVPTEVELSDLVALVGERVRVLRGAEERKQAQHRAKRRGALSEHLVGVTDPAQIQRILTGQLVPGLAAACRLLLPGDEDLEAQRRVPATGWPAVALSGLVNEEPATIALVDDLARLAVRAAKAAVDVAGEQSARRVLERSLLPSALLPRSGLKVAARYRPAGGSNALAGGDFYDVLHRGNETVLIVGDVQGKGVEAAALTSVARHTLRAGALRGVAPAPLLTLLNDVLLYGFEEQRSAGEQPVPRFMTAVVAHLQPDGDRLHLTLARAGHPPPIVVRRTGGAEMLQPYGSLLGVSDDLALAHAETDLELGDTLLLYTDGVTEQRPSGEPFDEHALARLVRGRSDLPGVDELAQLVLDTVLLVTKSHQRDDIALVIARPS